MKRCPQCEFIYEEDQKLCDMDGTSLVHDPGVLTENAKLQIKSSPKSVSKVMAQAGIPLVILAFLAFYVFSLPSSSNNVTPRAAVNTNGSNSAESPSNSPGNQADNPASVPTPENNESAHGTEKNNGRVPVENHQMSNDPAPLRDNKPPFSRIKPVTPKRSRTEEQRKDSKVTSFLKKTGRFLKKPFQL